MTDSPLRTGPWILAAILLLSLCLRLYHVDRYGLFFDEKSTLLISQGVCLEAANQKDVFTTVSHTPAGDTVYALRNFTPAEFWAPKTVADFIEANIRGDIGNSPTYYAVLWVWIKIFGLSDLSIRLPSVLFSTLLVLLLYAFVRRHIRLTTAAQTERLALLSAVLAAIEPFFIAHSQVARNYSFTFLLTLSATYLFLSILELANPRPGQVRSRGGQRNTLLPILLYGALFVASVLSHYLAIIVFMCHGSYALLILRKARTWLQLGATATLGIGLISLWFLFGGGTYTFKTLAYQASLYKSIALTNPLHSSFGIILPATIPNILVRAAPIFSDLFIFTNGLVSTILGIRNAAVALGLGALATGILHVFFSVKAPHLWVKVSFAGLLLTGLPLYSIVPGRFLVLSAMLPLFYLMWMGARTLPNQATQYRVGFLLLLSFLPTFFLLFMAWRSGHTFGITQRYSGFSFPYLIILIALGLRQLTLVRWWFATPLAAVLAVQLYFVGLLLSQIYGGQEAKYTQFGTPRERNPYWSIAQTIKNNYVPGDTIVYPNKNKTAPMTKIDASFIPVSVLDAQLVNVYLPKNATYVQRIDPNEHDRVFVVGKSRKARKLIYNLDGRRY